MSENALRLGAVIAVAAAMVAALFVAAWSDTVKASTEQCHSLGGVYINHTCQYLQETR